MTGAIRQQLNSFLEGFYDIIPKRLISIFNEQELELLISGLPTIDIDDLKQNTEYHKYQTTSLQVHADMYGLKNVFPVRTVSLPCYCFNYWKKSTQPCVLHKNTNFLHFPCKLKKILLHFSIILDSMVLACVTFV